MYPTELSRIFSGALSAFGNKILTSVWELNIKVVTVDDRRNSLTDGSWDRIEGTRTSPRSGIRTVRSPQEISKGLSIHLAGEMISVVSATKGQKYLLPLGLAVLHILGHSGAIT